MSNRNLSVKDIQFRISELFENYNDLVEFRNTVLDGDIPNEDLVREYSQKMKDLNTKKNSYMRDIYSSYNNAQRDKQIRILTDRNDVQKTNNSLTVKVMLARYFVPEDKKRKLKEYELHNDRAHANFIKRNQKLSPTEISTVDNNLKKIFQTRIKMYNTLYLKNILNHPNNGLLTRIKSGLNDNNPAYIKQNLSAARSALTKNTSVTAHTPYEHTTPPPKTKTQNITSFINNVNNSTNINKNINTFNLDK
jgi:hypothetical protein